VFMPIQKDPEGTETMHLLGLTGIANKNVLEIGCGDGRLTWRYASSASRVAAIDPEGVTLQTAIQALPSGLRGVASFACASSLSLPFPPATFDTAILAWSL
jgi:ubiquinone/menaquinone biosynthesis C-methylase UbiE